MVPLPTPTMIDPEQRQAIWLLLSTQRWAALATIDHAGGPAASMVAYTLDRERGELLFHLSRLSAHTRAILDRPAISLVVSEPDCAIADPQQLARVSLEGDITPIRRDSDDEARARTIYLDHLPLAEPRFDFGDFQLFRFLPVKGRYIGGFGRAASFSWSRFFPSGHHL